MNDANLFKKLELEAFRAGINPRTDESRAWFRRRIHSIRRVNRTELMGAEEVKLVNKSQPLIGSMNMFFYDPKGKETLPVYDRFPLAIIVGPAEGGFYGMNLHYLPPVLRAKALDAILGEGEVPEKFIRPTIHRYLTKQVRSKFALVEKPEWEIATFLPTADFRGAGTGTVYRDSRRKM